MQIGMIGLGRMGANMVRRLIRQGHSCVVFNRSPQAVNELVKEKAIGATSLAEVVTKLAKPRAIWMMVPAAGVDDTIAELSPHLEAGDILIDGGNSYYVDDLRRAKQLAPQKEYSLTSWGQSLCPALDAILKWADRRPAHARTPTTLSRSRL